MKRTVLLTVCLFCAVLTFPLTGMAADMNMEIGKSDSVITFLERNVGQRVEISLLSGEVLSGKVAAATPLTIHLTELTGKEFYDAVIRSDAIAAVVVRVK